MTLAEKLKQRLIFEIERIASKCQIYYNPNTKSIWFINPETKFWYFEYSLDGDLWWRYTAFRIFKDLYRMDDKTFSDIISEWVEETLNCKVVGTVLTQGEQEVVVEETLKCKVLSTNENHTDFEYLVENTLNCKVLTTSRINFTPDNRVEEGLNCKVLTTKHTNWKFIKKVEETLKCKVLETTPVYVNVVQMVEETLKCKVITIEPYEPFNEVNTDKIINESQTI